MGATDSRLERMADMDRRLAASNRGYTTTELAALYGVDPATIYRDLMLLQSMGTALRRVGRRYVPDGDRQLYRAKFTLDELLALYLAARLLTRHSDEANLHVTHALEKLADALRTRAPLMARHIDAAAVSVSRRTARPDYIQRMETLGRAWAEGRKVRLVYRSYSKGETTERVFAPYFIEPAGVGYATHVIGFDDLRGKIRTLKVERIVAASLTDERFTIPASFDPSSDLSTAWGIIWAEGEQVEVQLRFTPHAAQRVRESVWHSSQRLEDLPDGWLLFTVQIGSAMELKPWIRQWGADVEVLAPRELREEMVHELQEQLALYMCEPLNS